MELASFASIDREMPEASFEKNRREEARPGVAPDE
jgi:hypothetical protein